MNNLQTETQKITPTKTEPSILPNTQISLADEQNQLANGRSILTSVTKLTSKDPKNPIYLSGQDGSKIILTPSSTGDIGISYWNQQTNTYASMSLNQSTKTVTAIAGTQREQPLAEKEVLKLVASALNNPLQPLLPTSTPKPLSNDPTGGMPRQVSNQTRAKTEIPSNYCISGEPVSGVEVDDLKSRTKIDLVPNQKLDNKEAQKFLSELAQQGRIVESTVEFKEILGKLETVTKSKFTPITIDTPYPTAFSLGNGQVGISTGLLTMLKQNYPDANEQKRALAFILSHEVAHDVLDHHQKKQILVEGRPKECGRSQAIYFTMETKLDRQQELEADTFAKEIMPKTGFKPFSGREIYQVLNSLSDLIDILPKKIDPSIEAIKTSKYNFGPTHPSPLERSQEK